MLVECMRLKFDLEKLGRQLALLLPERAFDGTRPIVDRDIAGGQLIHHIEERLSAAGLTDERIRSTVTGYSTTKLARGYARKHYNLKGTYLVGQPNIEKTSKPFGVSVGNTPYMHYHQTTEQELSTYECGYQIIPLAFATGSTEPDATLRRQWLDAGLYHVLVLNMGTFKEVQKITMVGLWDQMVRHDSIMFTRAGMTTTVDWSYDDKWTLPYGAEGKTLLAKGSEFAGHLKMVQGRGKKPDVDWCVALGEKVAFNQVGWNNKYDRPIAGNVAVLGRNDKATDAMKRFIICGSKEEAEFLAAYLKSVEFFILGSQIAAEKNFTLDLFNRLPMFVMKEKFSPEIIWSVMDAEKEFKTIFRALGIKR